MLRNQSAATMALAVGLVAGVAFTGWVLKTPPAARPAPAASIDYAAITSSVRAAFPPAPAAVAPVKAPAAVAPVKRKAVRVVTVSRPSAVILHVVPRCTCSI